MDSAPGKKRAKKCRLDSSCVLDLVPCCSYSLGDWDERRKVLGLMLFFFITESLTVTIH